MSRVQGGVERGDALKWRFDVIGDLEGYAIVKGVKSVVVVIVSRGARSTRKYVSVVPSR